MRNGLWLGIVLLGGLLVALNAGRRRPYQGREQEQTLVSTELERKLCRFVRDDAELQSYDDELLDVLKAHRDYQLGKTTKDVVAKEQQEFVGLLKDDGVKQAKVDAVERMLLCIVNS